MAGFVACAIALCAAPSVLGAAAYPPFGAAARNVAISGSAETVILAYNVSKSGGDPRSGKITTIWIESAEFLWPNYDICRLRIYADGDVVPSIDVPLGFFDIGDMSPWGVELLGNTGAGGAEYFRFPVAFNASVRVALLEGTGDLGSHKVHVVVSGSEVPGFALARTIAQANSMTISGAGGRANLFSFLVPAALPLLPDGSTVRPLLMGISVAASNSSFYGNGGAVWACADALSDAECVPLSYGLESLLLAETGFGFAKYATPVAGITAKALLGQNVLGWRRFDAGWPWGANVTIVWDAPSGAGEITVLASTWAEVGPVIPGAWAASIQQASRHASAI